MDVAREQFKRYCPKYPAKRDIVTIPRRLSPTAGVTAVLFLLCACDGTYLAPETILGVAPPAVRQSRSPENARSALAGNAEEQRQKALAGRRLRGEQDEMLRFESDLPGFGGFYVDASDHVVIYLKPSAGTDANRGRRILAKHFAGRQPSYERGLAPAMAQARVVAADYALSELVAYERMIADPPVPIPGYVGVGVLITKNRVEVSFETSVQMAEGLKAIAAFGIPSGAIVGDVTGPLVASTTWYDVVRPSRAGINLTMFNPSFSSTQYGFAHGFNVRIWSGETKFLTVSHAPNIVYGTNGMTGAPVYQPNVYTATLGSIGLNPAWDTMGCGEHPTTFEPIDFCTTADAALGDFAAGNSGDRRMGTSKYGGLDGALGTATINGWYPIYGATNPDLISIGSNRALKSGPRTGTTYGDLGRSCFDAVLRIGWGSATAGGPTKLLRVFCASEILHAGWGAGDSGSPVVAQVTAGSDHYTAIGMSFGGIGSQDSSGICNAGTACRVIYSKWGAIEGRLGSVDPSTQEPPL